MSSLTTITCGLRSKPLFMCFVPLPLLHHYPIRPDVRGQSFHIHKLELIRSYSFEILGIIESFLQVVEVSNVEIRHCIELNCMLIA